MHQICIRSAIDQWLVALKTRCFRTAIALLGAMSAGAAVGAPITVVGYGIDHAAATSFGLCAHVYTGATQSSITELSVEGEVPPSSATRVEIEVKPGKRHNLISLLAGPKFRVAVLSSSTFDARTVNPSSLTFGHTGDEPSLRYCRRPRDVSGDGRVDLACAFSIAATGLTEGPTVAVLKGSTTGGIAIFGTARFTFARASWPAKSMTTVRMIDLQQAAGSALAATKTGPRSGTYATPRPEPAMQLG